MPSSSRPRATLDGIQPTAQALRDGLVLPSAYQVMIPARGIGLRDVDLARHIAIGALSGLVVPLLPRKPQAAG